MAKSRLAYLLGELLHLSLLDRLDAFILAALLGQQVILQLEHVGISLDHFSVVVLGSLMLDAVFFAKGERLVHVGKSLIVAARRMIYRVSSEQELG